MGLGEQGQPRLGIGLGAGLLARFGGRPSLLSRRAASILGIWGPRVLHGDRESYPRRQVLLSLHMRRIQWRGITAPELALEVQR